MEKEDLLILKSILEEKIQCSLVEKQAKFNFLEGIKVWEENDSIFIEIPKKLYTYEGKVSKKRFSKSEIKKFIYSSLNQWKSMIEYDTINII